MRYFVTDNAIYTEEELENLISSDWVIDENENVYFEFFSKEEMLNSLNYNLEVEFYYDYLGLLDLKEKDGLNDEPHFQKFKKSKLEELEKNKHVDTNGYTFYIVEDLKKYEF